MKIMVFIKRVPDTGIPVKVNAEGTDIERENLTYVMNPYDEFALEEAIRLKEKHGDVEIVVVSLGDDSVKETLRNALALGADRAVHIKVDPQPVYDPKGVAKALYGVIQRESEIDLILMGKEAVDDNFGLVPAYLSVLANLPLISLAIKLEIKNGKVNAVRETDDGGVEVNASLPCIVTCEKGLNEPRLATLRGIMMAKRKPIDEVEGEVEATGLIVNKFEMPPEKEAGIVIDDDFPANVEKLLSLLQEKKVL